MPVQIMKILIYDYICFYKYLCNHYTEKIITYHFCISTDEQY